MTPRKRKDGNEHLPKHLYFSGGSYVYRHPLTGKRHGVGSDEAKAIAAAKKLNDILQKERDLVQSVLVADTLTFGQVLKRYETEHLPAKKLKPGSLKIQGYRLARLDRDLGSVPMADLGVFRLSNYLDENHQRDAYIKHRGLLIDIFRFAISKGLVDDNPAEKTLAKNDIGKDRMPLTLEQFKAIRSHAQPWLQLAMDLALVTLQRRGDLIKMRYDDIREGTLFVVQEKTEKHGVRARLAIGVGEQLQELVALSRQDRVVTPYIIHEVPKRKVKSAAKDHWSQVLPDRLSKQFAAARDASGLFEGVPEKSRPTFHEIRALGGFLYLEAGYSKDYVNLLMGHTTMAMTEHYTDRHQTWTACAADLKLLEI